MSDRESVVIVGAGHAGGSVAALLRQYGWRGAITLIGTEPIPPYQRPPLSKAWLKGEANADGLALNPRRFHADANIELRLAATVESIDRTARAVTLAGGERIAYGRLILAAGSRPRRLDVPGRDLAGIHELRTIPDADALAAALRPGVRLAVVGGGYIGLEVAASARALGANVTVIEREARVLARVASAPLSAFFEATHRAHSVALELGAGVERFVGDAAGQVCGVVLASGRTLACDAALVGIGALANDGLARAAGLACADGVVVDLAARGDDPDIYAIGDCAYRPLPIYGRRGRLESVPNALEQARQAAADICGRPPPAPEAPWFWSDQYDVRLRIAGLPFDVHETVVRGAPESGCFAVFHLARDGCIQCVEAVNSGAEFMAGRVLIANRRPVSPDRLADPTTVMRELAR